LVDKTGLIDGLIYNGDAYNTHLPHFLGLLGSKEWGRFCAQIRGHLQAVEAKSDRSYEDAVGLFRETDFENSPLRREADEEAEEEGLEEEETRGGSSSSSLAAAAARIEVSRGEKGKSKQIPSSSKRQQAPPPPPPPHPSPIRGKKTRVGSFSGPARKQARPTTLDLTNKTNREFVLSARSPPRLLPAAEEGGHSADSYSEHGDSD
jgi:hypothetical protein